MVAIIELRCPANGCAFVAKRDFGLTRHRNAMHSGIEQKVEKRKDGQVDINMAAFGGEFPEPITGGFWRSVLLTPATWGVMAVFGLLSYQAATTNILNALGLVVAGTAVILAMWWMNESRTHIQVGVISDPPDPDGRIRLTFQWWLSSDANKLPLEAKRGDIYVIDTTGEKPVVFTPFTTPPPEYAVPVRGAMVNQQIDNEQLNKVHYKGIRPEVVKQAFALAVIGGLLLANIAVFGQLTEFLNK